MLDRFPEPDPIVSVLNKFPPLVASYHFIYISTLVMIQVATYCRSAIRDVTDILSDVRILR
jgi:hypothetical protein